MTPACCKVGLDRPLTLTAFVADLFRSVRSLDLAVWPTEGLQVTHRRPGTGRPTLAEDGRVRNTVLEPAFERTWFKPRMARGTNRRP